MDVSLVLLKKNGSQKVFTLREGVTTIGRRSDCQLRIPLMEVSRKHCQLERNGQAVKLRDLGSRNGTFLNNDRIEEATVNPGDSIRIGPVRFILEAADYGYKQIVTPSHQGNDMTCKDLGRQTGIDHHTGSPFS